MEQPTTDTENGGENTDREEYILTFTNGALEKLKELADKFDIDESNLDQVVQKGLKVLELPEDNKLMFVKGGERYVVDIKNL